MNIRTLRTHKILVGVAAAVCVAAASGALADAANDTPSLTVRYADLNLNTRAGVSTLYRRIEHAALRVCGDEGTRDPARQRVVQSCVDQAMASSVRFVNNEELTQLYASRVDTQNSLVLAER